MYQRIDTARLLADTDLLEVVSRDLGAPVRSSGSRHYWHCPFHDDHTPSLEVNAKKQRAFCNVPPCNFGLNAIRWTMKYHRLDFIAACERLGALPAMAPEQPRPQQPASGPEPPNDAWQSRARDVIRWSVAALHRPQGARALAWLQARGLNLATLDKWHIGFNPCDVHERPERWGLTANDCERVWVPRGIVVPCEVDGQIWGLHVRRAVGAPKMPFVNGSRQAVWGTRNLKHRRVALLAAGEFDAMLALQESLGFVGAACFTTGEGTNWHSYWGRYFFEAERVLVAYDADQAGHAGALKLIAVSDRMAPCAPPTLRAGDKDITDFHIAGGDLFGWLYKQRRAALNDSQNELAARISRLLPHRAPGQYADLLFDYEQFCIENGSQPKDIERWLTIPQ